MRLKGKAFSQVARERRKKKEKKIVLVASLSAGVTFPPGDATMKFGNALEPAFSERRKKKKKEKRKKKKKKKRKL